MYFYNTMEPGELGDGHPGYAICVCEQCGETALLYLDECEEVTDNHVKLKGGINLICEKCGNKAERIIRYRPLEEATSQPTNQCVPKCPICHSPNIHKITTAKKVSRVAMFGIFSLPKIGKQWKCDNCGSEF